MLVMTNTPFRPTDRQRDLVRKMIAYGLNYKQIASCITWADGRSISVECLQSSFASELDMGLAMATTDAAECIMNIIKHGSDERVRFDAAKYFLSTRGKWRTADSIAATEMAQKHLISESAKRPDLLLELKHTMEQAYLKSYKQIEKEVIDSEKG